MNTYPTIVPFQIGGALLPRIDWEGTPSWPSVETVRPIPGLDFGVDDQRWRSNLSMGTLNYSGRYDTVGSAPGRELRMIDSGIGVWQPLIGYIDEGECDDCDSCGCPTRITCIKWVWTWAKLMAVSPAGSLNSRMAEPDPITFNFKLREPFRQATHHWWRWGSEPPVSRCYTQREVEAQIMLSRGEFFPPCVIPSCSSPVRWWFKDWRRYFGFDPDSMTVADRYSKEAFPGQVYKVRRGCISIDAGGSYEPACYVRVDITGDVVVNNDLLGEMQFKAKANRVYDQGEGYAYNGETPIAERVPFRLGPGVNKITTTGQLEIGVIPRWLR